MSAKTSVWFLHNLSFSDALFNATRKAICDDMARQAVEQAATWQEMIDVESYLIESGFVAVSACFDTGASDFANGACGSSGQHDVQGFMRALEEDGVSLSFKKPTRKFHVPVTTKPIRGADEDAVTVCVHVKHTNQDTNLSINDAVDLETKRMAYTLFLARYEIIFDESNMKDEVYCLKGRILRPLFVFGSYGNYCSCCTSDYRMVLVEADDRWSLYDRLKNPVIVDALFSPKNVNTTTEHLYLNWRVGGLTLTELMYDTKKNPVFDGHLLNCSEFNKLYPNAVDWLAELIDNTSCETDYVTYYGTNYDEQEVRGMLEGVPQYDYEHTEHSVYRFPLV
jgi:hypothetical protein